MPAANQMQDMTVSTAQDTSPDVAPQGRNAKRLAVFLPSLAAGGVARVVLSLIADFVQRGQQVDLVLCQVEGAFAGQIPEQVRVVQLEPEADLLSRLRALAADRGGFAVMLLPILLPLHPAPPMPYLGAFARYLRSERPDVVFAAKPHTNLVALWARRLAGIRTRVVASEHTDLTHDLQSPKRRKWRWRFVVPLLRRTYPWADAIVTVSDGVAEDLSKAAGVPRDLISTIYNPIVRPDLQEKAEAPLDHPWFAAGAPPVVLGVGRLVPQKDFPTLLRAFALVRAQREVRLLILGEGKSPKRRAELFDLARDLGIAEDLSLPGFVENPYAYMARAGVFALSSAWEGFANVLAEAAACGCPVVSTDCPSGPAEVLDGGAYGRLVPVGDHAALAEAIIATLDDTPDRARLRRRAMEFSVERAADRYLEVLFDHG